MQSEFIRIENDKKITFRKMTEVKFEKRPEWKLHNLENTTMKNRQPEKYQNGNCRVGKFGDSFEKI